MAIEGGARAGLVAWTKTINYVKGRLLTRQTPKQGTMGAGPGRAYRANTAVDPDAKFDAVVELDAAYQFCRRSAGARLRKWCCQSTTSCQTPDKEKDATNAMPSSEH
jgi:homoaconitase/3-isopropylmalate dehydratase large subunit